MFPETPTASWNGVIKDSERVMGIKLFISYSHKDAAALDRLHTHFATLRREKLIDAWFDREVLAGDELDRKIRAELDASQVFIALASPDFLASNYCVEKEMEHALNRFDQGLMRVVPVIIEPCEWKKTPLGRFKALPKDRIAVVDWKNQNAAYLDVTTEIRRIVEEEGRHSHHAAVSPTIEEERRPAAARRYRVQRDFDEVDRKAFGDEAFGTISTYFEAACVEIAQEGGIKSRYVDRRDGFSATIVNRAKERGTANITVHRGGGRHSLGDIYYSWADDAEKNSANGWFSIESDDYELFLEHKDFVVGEKRMTPQEAAEALWIQFLDKVGIKHA